MYFVYILRTASDALYIGVTQALDERIDAHHSSRGAEWTRVHPGAQVVYSESYPTLGLARKREIQLKKWSRDKKGGIDRRRCSHVEESQSLLLSPTDSAFTKRENCDVSFLDPTTRASRDEL